MSKGENYVGKLAETDDSRNNKLEIRIVNKCGNKHSLQSLKMIEAKQVALHF